MTAALDRNVRWLAPAGILMVVGFFGPWIDLFGLVTMSGYELARETPLGWDRHLLWLFPLGGAALAATALAGSRSARALALLAGAGVVTLVGWTVMSDLRYGAWLTVLGAVVALIGGCGKDHRAGAFVGAVMIVVGFFLPWVSDGGATLSGFDLARLDPPEGLGLPSPAWLYLVPAFGVAALAASLSPKARGLAVAAAVGVLGVLAYVYLRTASLFLGWGVWTTLGAGLVAPLLLVLASRRR